MDTQPDRYDAIVVGSGLSGGACAKRLVDAGFKTLVIEEKPLPRHKICSGILSPRGTRFIRDTYGPIPIETLNRPHYIKGVNFLFPDGDRLAMDFDAGPTPQVWRKPFDHWVVRQSGAAIHDRTRFLDLEREGDLIRVRCLRAEAPVTYTTRFLVGADGPLSTVLHRVCPGFRQSIQWFIVGDRFYRGTLGLDPDYFHFLVNPVTGYYSWTHMKDGEHIIGATVKKGDNFNRRLDRVIGELKRHHGLVLDRETFAEGTQENFGLSVSNNFWFGKGNVLVTGQAAGFLNMMAEGMSCALYSGAIAGESIAEAAKKGAPAHPIFEQRVMSERIRTVDQWNPLKIALEHPHEASIKKALRRRDWPDRVKILRQMWDFVRPYGEFGWLRPMIASSLRRMVTGRY